MTLTDTLSFLAFVPAVAFAVYYAFFPWYRTTVGRSTMALAVVIVLALSMSVWRQIAEHAPPEWYRVTVFVLIIAALWAQLIVLIVEQRRGRGDPRGRG
jgi:CDP-diglyceride synthetase